MKLHASLNRFFTMFSRAQKYFGHTGHWENEGGGHLRFKPTPLLSTIKPACLCPIEFVIGRKDYEYGAQIIGLSNRDITDIVRAADTDDRKTLTARQAQIRNHIRRIVKV